MFNKIIDIFFHSIVYKKLFLQKQHVLFDNKINLDIFNGMHYSGHSILYGEFNVFGYKYTTKDFLEEELPKHVMEYFHGFYWLSSLKVINTKEAAETSFNLIELWSIYSKFFNSTLWKHSLVSERCFQMTLCKDFILQDKNSVYHAKFYKLLNLHINHLFNLFYLYKLKIYKLENKLALAKSLLLVILSGNLKDDNSKLIQDILNIIDIDIRENILHDGGHISRNPSITLSYLEELLIIYYLIKDFLAYSHDLSFLRVSIDRIAIFIKTLRHQDGSLAIFNGSSETFKEKVDYLISLTSISKQTSVILRNSGYKKVEAFNTTMFFDVGKRTKKQNSLLSFELSMNNNKIITNLPCFIAKNSSSDIINAYSSHMSNSCIVMKIDNKFVSFDLSKDNLKVENHFEDNWQVIKFIYSGFNNIIYYSTFYISQTDFACVLGESLISFKKNFNKHIQEAFLRFHLSPGINYVDVQEQGKSLSFAVNNRYYKFVSTDNPIKVSKSTYELYNRGLMSCYTLDIYFNFNNNVVKNEWSLKDNSNNKDKDLNMNENKIKILNIIDMQNSFVAKNGALYIQGAEDLIEKTNIFLKDKHHAFDHIIFTQDTHFIKEYQDSQEAKEFPFHCEYGSEDWQLAITTEYVSSRYNVYKLYKNSFNMWDNQQNEDIKISLDFHNALAYNNLYKLIDFNGNIFFNSVDDFLQAQENKQVEIYIMGVASDFCVKYAIEGYIKRGFKVYIIKDLSKGIYQDIFEVLNDNYFYKSDILNIRLITSSSI